MNTIHKTTTSLLNILFAHRRMSEASENKCPGTSCPECNQLPLQKIKDAVLEQRMLTLILPAFPAKSANRRKPCPQSPIVVKL